MCNKEGLGGLQSCTDTMFMLKQLIEKSIEFNIPVFLGSIDLEKVFSSVLNILEKGNFPRNVIKIINKIYTENQTLFKT
jgi:hypothetical protein